MNIKPYYSLKIDLFNSQIKHHYLELIFNYVQSLLSVQESHNSLGTFNLLTCTIKLYLWSQTTEEKKIKLSKRLPESGLSRGCQPLISHVVKLDPWRHRTAASVTSDFMTMYYLIICTLHVGMWGFVILLEKWFFSFLFFFFCD